MKKNPDFLFQKKKKTYVKRVDWKDGSILQKRLPTLYEKIG